MKNSTKTLFCLLTVCTCLSAISCTDDTQDLSDVWQSDDYNYIGKILLIILMKKI